MTTERNYYQVHLRQAASTVATQRDNVSSSPLNPATPITRHASIGWECSEADDWLDEVRDRCGAIPNAFNDARDLLNETANAQPDEVPENHHHGLAWNRRRYGITPSYI